MRARGLGGDVGVGVVQGLPGDLLGAVQDGADGGAADQPQQAPDHAVGALVQVAAQSGQGARPVAVQPQAVLQCSDQRGPLLVLAERGGADDAGPAGDLFPAGAGQQPGAVQADSRVGKGGRDPLGEVLQGVGGFGAGTAGGVEVVQLVDRRQGDMGVQ